MIPLACSQISRARLCPASVYHGTASEPVAGYTDAAVDAAVRQRVHNVIGLETPATELGIPCPVPRGQHCVPESDRAEVDRLVARSLHLWSTLLSPHFREALTGQYLAVAIPCDILIFGTPDLMVVEETVVRVAHFELHEQVGESEMLGYAWLSSSLTGAPETVVSGIDVTNDHVVTDLYERAELEAWASRLEERLAKQDVFLPGSHCRGCGYRPQCEAASKYFNGGGT